MYVDTFLVLPVINGAAVIFITSLLLSDKELSSHVNRDDNTVCCHDVIYRMAASICVHFKFDS